MTMRCTTVSPSEYAERLINLVTRALQPKQVREGVYLGLHFSKSDDSQL